jgi:hypothetical protein
MRDFMTRCGDFGFSDLESWTRLYFLEYKGCHPEFIEKVGPLTWTAASGAANNRSTTQLGTHYLRDEA